MLVRTPPGGVPCFLYQGPCIWTFVMGYRLPLYKLELAQGTSAGLSLLVRFLFLIHQNMTQSECLCVEISMVAVGRLFLSTDASIPVECLMHVLLQRNCRGWLVDYRSMPCALVPHSSYTGIEMETLTLTYTSRASRFRPYGIQHTPG
jgi:hypothetical protein